VVFAMAGAFSLGIVIGGSGDRHTSWVSDSEVQRQLLS
jgi:hypothetical protein